jgi:hypothetical protein
MIRTGCICCRNDFGLTSVARVSQAMLSTDTQAAQCEGNKVREKVGSEHEKGTKEATE